jgi:uncharacterized 2Fe-2S/4Fe-4S cluster protein (DUF4445 family)
MISHNRKIQIALDPLNRKIEGEEGKTLYEVLSEEGIEIDSLCGGRGICGKCKVQVKSEGSIPLTPAEKEKLSAAEIDQGVRLACQIRLNENLSVVIPHERKNRRILTSYDQKEFGVDPPVTLHHLTIPPRSEGSDLARMNAEIGTDIVFTDLSLLRKVPHALREEDGRVTLYVSGNRGVDIRSGHHEECYGLAVDIGTTTVVTQLFDLQSGKMLWTESSINPQVKFGEDLMSRITHCLTGNGLHQLNTLILEKINDLINRCLTETKIPEEDIFEVAIVGNTSMLHLFLNIFPKYLAISPFVPVIKNNLNIKAPQGGLTLENYCNIHLLPSISSFVGADHVGAILATEIYKTKHLSLLIDIGTNTEITLGNKKKLLCCSTAAGPAFEGMNITHGMRAENGAINGVKIERETKKIVLDVIGEDHPRGICGSGLIDATAEMLKRGILDAKGKIIRQPGFSYRTTEGETEVVLHESSSITLTQKDIKEIQLAKAAIFAGISVLCQKYGCALNDIEKIFIAGAFGTYINQKNATLIGLLPESGVAKFVGNAALHGAAMALLSKKYRKMAEKIQEKVKYIEISTEKKFEEHFIDAFYFPHKNEKLFPSSIAHLSELR